MCSPARLLIWQTTVILGPNGLGDKCDPCVVLRFIPLQRCQGPQTQSQCVSLRHLQLTTPLPLASFPQPITDALKRFPHAVRGLFPLEQTPGVISLLAGKPNAALFPFTSVQFTTPAPAVPGGGGDRSEQTLLRVDDDLLAMGLQYAPTSGIPPMVEWLIGFQEREHARRRSEGWRVSVTAGSQDAIYKVRRRRPVYYYHRNCKI